MPALRLSNAPSSAPGRSGGGRMRRLSSLVALGIWATFHSTTAEGREQAGMTVSCIDSGDPLTRVPSNEMLAWMGRYSAQWNPSSSFSVGAVGAQGRLFDPKGRLLHPAELASGISAAPAFSGKKRKEVWLGASDSASSDENSYASRLARLLGTKVVGCSADAYFMAGGIMLCGSKPVFGDRNEDNRGRSMPLGFALGDSGLLMLFCAKENAAISPHSMLTSSVVFSLDPQERIALESAADSQPDSAFRLYQYYWIAKRDPVQALVWLEKAAELGSDRAQFNLAYELLEQGTAESRSRANGLLDKLAARGAPYPDLRKYYPS